MANDNFYPGPMSGQPLGTGEGESPLAKPTVPNVDARTMASDVQSVNAGSPATKPYAPQASAPDNIPMAPMPPSSPASPEQSFQIPQADSAAVPPSPETPAKKSERGIFTALVVFVAVIALAALGYFVVYPIFFAAPTTTTPAPVATNPEPTPPANKPTPAPTPEATTTTPPPPAPAPTHVSLFTIPADSQIEATTVTTGAALLNLSITGTSPNLTEMVYKDSNGNPVKTANVLKTALGLVALALNYEFNERGAAGLVYTDSNNARWLGFVFQLADSTDLQAKISGFQSLFEQFSGFSNLFSSDPGTAQNWKDGQVTGVTANRYLLFSKPGFAVDYGWVGNKLLIMTSYNGFKEAARRLQ